MDSTKSGVDDVQLIRWPGAGVECVKTPSIIAYKSENPDYKFAPGTPEILWGYQVEPALKSYSWMKLWLDKNAALTGLDDSSLASLRTSNEGIMRLPKNKEAVDVVADYLGCVYKWIISELERTWGAGMMKVTPLEFWVTHPATW